MKEKVDYEEFQGKLKFYDDEIEVLFPNNFEIFKKKLSEMLDLTEDFLVNVIFSYIDENGNKNIIKNIEDYQIFIKNIKSRKDSVVLLVEVKEESNLNIKRMSTKIINYVDKKGNRNISKNNSIEINSEIKQNNNNLINNDSNNVNQLNKNNFHNEQHINNQIPQKNNSYNQNQKIVFPLYCTICKESPLYNVIYYCKDCNKIFCSKCEEIEGPDHPDPYYKIQNMKQYEKLNINGKSQFEKIIDGVEGKIEGAVNNVIGFLKNNINSNNNNESNNNKRKYSNNNLNNNYRNYKQREIPNQSLIQKARASYDLSNVSDQQIEDALKKTKGNIDNAVILLTTQ